MLPEYNPFRRKEIEETEHGIINYRHKLGRIYTTHRRPEHYFKKYQGFAISNTEIEVIKEALVEWIIIIYHNDKKEQKVMRINTKYIRYMEEYNNNGDVQKIFPEKELEKLDKETGEWKKWERT